MEFAKKLVASILFASIGLFTLLAILSIWEVLAEEVAWKSLSTLGVIFVASMLTMKIVETREHKKKSNG